MRDVADPGQPMPDEKPSRRCRRCSGSTRRTGSVAARGVGVAVIDSGVDAGTGALDVRGGLSAGGARGGRRRTPTAPSSPAWSPATTAKRGIVGIAPDAQSYPSASSTSDADVVDEGRRLEAGNLAAGIREATKLRNGQNIRGHQPLAGAGRTERGAWPTPSPPRRRPASSWSPPSATGPRTTPGPPLPTPTRGGEAGPVPGHGEGRPRGHRARCRPATWTRRSCGRPRHRRVRPGGQGVSVTVAAPRAASSTSRPAGRPRRSAGSPRCCSPRTVADAGAGQHPDRGHRARGGRRQRRSTGTAMVQPLEALTADLEIAEDGTLWPRAGVHHPARRGEGPRAAARHLRGVPADDAVVGDRCRWGAAARAAAAAADRAPAYLTPNQRGCRVRLLPLPGGPRCRDRRRTRQAIRRGSRAARPAKTTEAAPPGHGGAASSGGG